jgi:hypothetical protein
MAYVDAIAYAWSRCNPRVPIPAVLQAGPSTIEGAPQPDPVRTEAYRAYQRDYQRRLRRSKKS